LYIISQTQGKRLARGGKMNFKLGIGIPLTWSHVPSDFFDSCLVMNKHGAEIIRASSGPIHAMRNTIALRALEMDCSHLIFLDADMVYPPDTITRLLEHDLDIVGALTFKRWPNFEPLVFEGEPYNMTLVERTEIINKSFKEKTLIGRARQFLGFLPSTRKVAVKTLPEGLVKVTATGTGCLLIKTTVLETLGCPWFEFSHHDGKPVGEDINFCYNAGKAGYDIYVDTTVRTEHLAQTRVNWNLYQLNKKMMEQGVGSFNF
jgi:hypothetical protein